MHLRGRREAQDGRNASMAVMVAHDGNGSPRLSKRLQMLDVRTFWHTKPGSGDAVYNRQLRWPWWPWGRCGA